MAKSNIRIKKICEWCGQEFVAQKVTTKYCSHRCANLAYKQAIRAKRIQQEEQRIQIVKTEKPLMDIKDKEYLSIAQAATLLGLSLQAVYKMIYTGHLAAYKLSSRLSFVRQSDIEEMLKRNPYKKRQPKDTLPITDFYTTNEIKEKFGVKDSWIFHIAKEKAPDPEIKEWYSTQDMQEKFGMTLTAIYSFVSKNAIPKKKVGIMVYYSKKHVDIAKGLIAPEEPKYYTIAEAMERFNLTRDQLYHYVKYHNIPRIKVGKYTKILRVELDKFFEPPKIE